MYTLVDIGANLTHETFSSDRAGVIERAITAGVTRMIVTGATAAGSEAALALTREWPRHLYATAGVHPHHASEYLAATGDLLRTLAAAERVVAIGECGLDYFRNFSPVAAQREAFAAQLDIAIETGKPVFLHQREAHKDFVDILRPRMPRLCGGVAHCFTGTTDELKTYLDMGLYIGVTGWICDERRGLALREALRYLPLERLMLETDAPYLAPRDLPYKLPARRNEPAVLPHILEAAARFMQQDIHEVAVAATCNSIEAFGLDSA